MSEEDQEEIFKAYGVCWSVLLDLPYWNPILFAVLNLMHAAYLGLSHSNSWKFWQINITIEGGDGTIKEDKTIIWHSDHILSLWLDTIYNTDTDLLYNVLNVKDCKKDILWHICVNHGIWSAGTWKQLIANIVKWVSPANSYLFLANFDVY